MKNFYLVFAVAMLAFIFVSCHKEGQFKPKEQIDRVLYSSSSTTKYMSQSWTWDGKKLSKIDHYSSNGSLSWTEYITYDDKNRISRVDDYGYNESVEYKYDGKNLKSVDYFDEGKLEKTINVTYDGKKISRLELVNYQTNKTTEAKHLNSLFAGIENKINERFENAKSNHFKATTVNNETIYVDIVWDGDNIAKTTFTLTRGGTYDSGEILYNVLYTYNVESVYTYDKNINPKYGLRNLYCVTEAFDDNSETMSCFSKNNLTSLSNRWNESYMINGQLDPDMSDSGIEEYNYTYTYDKNVPTECLVNHKEDGSSYAYTTYYEYK